MTETQQTTIENTTQESDRRIIRWKRQVIEVVNRTQNSIAIQFILWIVVSMIVSSYIHMFFINDLALAYTIATVPAGYITRRSTQNEE